MKTVIAVLPGKGMHTKHRDAPNGEPVFKPIHSFVFWQDADTNRLNVSRVSYEDLEKGHIALDQNGPAFIADALEVEKTMNILKRDHKIRKAMVQYLKNAEVRNSQL